jgi:UDP-N-acetyl-D-glucosamine dehydrogenase
MELLRSAGAEVSYHDPHVPVLGLADGGHHSVGLEPGAYDAVVIVTAHSGIDYARLVEDASLVVDLRNATGKAGVASHKVWKL